MQFINFTPFPAMASDSVDIREREHHVVIMRVTYQLLPLTGTPGRFVASVLEDDPPPIEMADRYAAGDGTSSLVCESDLAPFKPRCDVILTGVAHAPGGRPSRQWPVRLKVMKEASGGAGRRGSTDVLLEKTLQVHGPRSFRRGTARGWRLEPAEPAVEVPLCYELAYGGSSVVPGHDPAGDRHRDALEPLLNEVCFTNPLGRGWMHAEYESQARKAGLRMPDLMPAPQIEPAGRPVREPDVVAQPAGPLDLRRMAQVVSRYHHDPAGFGPLGRAWTPRIQKAGTYDERWLEQRWPSLPEDFDMGYWNGAPDDQQIPYPPSDLSLELLNLTDPALTPDGRLNCRLPGHRAAVLFRLRSGLLMAATPVIDTVHIDAVALRVSLVWRATITAEMNVAVAEARFETDPSRALFPLAVRNPDDDVPLEEESHG